MVTSIGIVSAPLGQVEPVRPAQRGAGLLALAKGLNGIGEALGQAATVADVNEDVLTDRQDRLDRATAMVEFTKLQGQWARDYVDMRNGAALDDPDFERRARTNLDERMKAFSETLPEKLRPEFVPTIEEFKQNQFNAARKDGLDLKAEKYNASMLDLQSQVQDSLLRGSKRREEWQPVIDEFFANSPYDEATTNKLKTEFMKDGAKLQLELDASAEMLYPEYSQFNVDGAPAGMPAVAMGLMSAFIGSEAPDWNTIYGGQKFSDFSDHPNVPVVITEGPNKGKTTTAAGGPQFLYSTWKEAQNALGLPDFSPANQMRAAWWLAQRDYKKRTGRDLQSDMESGSDIVLEGVRKNLAPTWEAFGKMDLAEFKARLQGSAAIPPSILDDPNYAGLTPVEKKDIYESALARAREQRNAMLSEQSKRNTEFFSAVGRDIQSGKMTSAALDDLIAKSSFTPDQVNTLYGLQQRYNEDEYNLGRFVSEASSSDSYWSDEAKKGFAVSLERGGIQGLLQGDQTFVQGTLLPGLLRAGTVPQIVTDSLQQMRSNGAPAEARFAYETIEAMRLQAPGAWAQLPKEMQSDAAYFRAAQNMPEAERLEMIKTFSQPEFQKVREIFKPELEKTIRDNMSDFSYNQILDADVASDPVEQTMFESDFLRMYEENWYRLKNHKDAWNATQSQISATWGLMQDTEGNNYITRYAPQLMGVPSVNGDWSWLNDVVVQDLGFEPGQKFQLKGDAQTKAEAAKGNPSYLVLKEYSPSQFMPVPDPETGLPWRVSFLDAGAPPKNVQQAAQDVSLWKFQSESANRLLNQMGLYAADPYQTTESDNAAGALVRKAYDFVQSKRPGNAAPARENPNVFPAITEAQEREMLRKLGFNSIEEFANNLNKFDVQTILDRLR